MEAYHKIVLAVAASVLLLYLLTVGFMMRRDDSAVPWPPVAGRCPDGWTEDATIQNQCTVSDTNRGLNSDGTAGAKRDANKQTSILTAKSPNAFREIKKGEWLNIFKAEWDFKNKFKIVKTLIGTYLVDSVEKNGKTLVLKDPNNEIDRESIIYSRSKITFNDKTICEKKKWANSWGIQWDGVTNYNKCK